MTMGSCHWKRNLRCPDPDILMSDYGLVCLNNNKITKILSVMALTSQWEGTKLWLENFNGEMNQYTEMRDGMEKSDIKKDTTEE